MTTQKFIESLENIIDTWSEQEIEPDKLIQAIKENIPEASVQDFIKDHGDCCIECALNTYFGGAEEYEKVDVEESNK